MFDAANTVDNHFHFSGALPLTFLWRCYLDSEKNPEVREAVAQSLSPLGGETLAQHDFEILIQKGWTGNWQANYFRFFLLYRFVQSITYDLRCRDAEKFYFQGTTEIIKSQLTSGVVAGEIIAGPSIDNNITTSRLVGMSKALDALKDQGFGIRLTFIRGADGKMRNLNIDNAVDLAGITRSSELSRHLRGFDVSGEENPNSISETVAAIGLAQKIRADAGRPDLRISVHCGENFMFRMADHLSALEEIVKTGIDRLCHATVLWISEDDMGFTSDEAYRRHKLLETMASKGIELEVCPSANLIMTPLANKLPSSLATLTSMGVKITINSDNPILFATAVPQEISRARLSSSTIKC